MAVTAFISDLHLHSSRPGITRLFFVFLDGEAARLDTLYILGDLFEFWIGDDDDREDNREIIRQLSRYTSSGHTVYFMRGNRDFLIGDQFAEMTGCRLLDDPAVINIAGNRILLMHGDTLCSDDVEYQAFRDEVRTPAWQTRVLAMPINERMDYFRSLREASQKSIQEKADEIMDVNQDTVEAVMRDKNVLTLIHGHTHRPGIHHFDLEDRAAQRIVLGDWYTQGSILFHDEQDFRLETRELPD